jgi:hypothetical protein
MPNGLHDKLHDVTVGPLSAAGAVKLQRQNSTLLKIIQADTFDLSFLKWVTAGGRQKVLQAGMRNATETLREKTKAGCSSCRIHTASSQ